MAADKMSAQEGTRTLAQVDSPSGLAEPTVTSLRPPCIMDSYGALLEATNEDLYEMTEWELEAARVRTVQIANADPRAFVWLGAHRFVTAAVWAEDRLQLIRELLDMPPSPPRPERAAERWSPWK